MTVAKELEWTPLLVTRIASSLMPWQKTTLEDTTEEAAAFVAYMNAPIDADFPDNLLRWAKLRAENGHPGPFRVPY